ncbi:MAG TPA: GyrI-like domain-containing protein, partial [Anaerolineales bacterium]|nr:GyrI-like domain-containing protein [Anaerolineales bacterium]
MSDIEIQIVQLSPMRVACVNGFGAGPEEIAFDKMKAWAAAHNLLGKPYRVFGYNNPDPSPGSPNYGYDVWVTVDETVQADGEAKIIKFPGGLYAVTHLEVQDPGTDIPGAWQKLVKWMESSKYSHGHHQWLEEHIGPLGGMSPDQPFTLDLHL